MPQPPQSPAPLVEIKDLTLDFGTGTGSVRAIDGLTLAIAPGETVCLVGESGSGKSATALSIARLVPAPPGRYSGGQILIEGRDVFEMGTRELRSVRGGTVSYIFQEPSASLNPVIRIGSQIGETLELHQPEKAGREAVIQWLRNVGIPAPETRSRDYPHQLSGGMQQRVMIAMALASEPKLLVADEPTTALDVTIQAQILELLAELKKRLGMAVLLITHNLALVGQIADRVAVMYAGQVVELAPARDLLDSPFHPYTRALMEAVPVLGASTGRLRAIPGTVPRPGALPTGCRFHPRCSLRQPDCSSTPPPLVEVQPGRWVRCPYWANQAP